jgi:hypothetical protein
MASLAKDMIVVVFDSVLGVTAAVQIYVPEFQPVLRVDRIYVRAGLLVKKMLGD